MQFRYACHKQRPFALHRLLPVVVQKPTTIWTQRLDVSYLPENTCGPAQVCGPVPGIEFVDHWGERDLALNTIETPQPGQCVLTSPHFKPCFSGIEVKCMSVKEMRWLKTCVSFGDSVKISENDLKGKSYWLYSGNDGVIIGSLHPITRNTPVSRFAHAECDFRYLITISYQKNTIYVGPSRAMSVENFPVGEIKVRLVVEVQSFFCLSKNRLCKLGHQALALPVKNVG